MVQLYRLSADEGMAQSLISGCQCRVTLSEHIDPILLWPDTWVKQRGLTRDMKELSGHQGHTHAPFPLYPGVEEGFEALDPYDPIITLHHCSQPLSSQGRQTNL